MINVILTLAETQCYRDLDSPRRLEQVEYPATATDCVAAGNNYVLSSSTPLDAEH